MTNSLWRKRQEPEALKLALEALEGWNYLIDPKPDADIITAIKEALAQPDQYAKGYADAMNWKTANHLEHLPVAKYSDIVSDGGLDPRNTTPPQRTWVGLTDEEIKAVNAQVSQIPPIDYTTTTYAKAIEAKLKQKNGYAEE